MAIITIHCPDCGRDINVDIKTIDALRKENEQLKKRIAELIKESSHKPNGDNIDWFFKTLGLK